MAKMGGQQQQEMNEFGQQFVGGRQQQQQQHQFGELMNLPCSPSVSGTAALSVVEQNPPPTCGAGGSSYLFQTASGSTICQLGTAPPPSAASVGGPPPPMDPCLCSPASSGSGSQTRLVHLSGASGGANDSGLSSLSGGFGGGGGGGGQPLHHHHSNFSPDVRGTEPLEELEPLARDRCNTWPLRRAMGLEGGNSQTSPLIHERIPEEESMYDDEESDAIDGGCVAGGGDDHHHHMLLQQQCHDAAMVTTTNGCHQMSVGGGSNSSNGTLAGAGLCCETMMAESPCSGVDGLHDAFHSDEMSPLGRPDSAIGDSCSRTDSPPSGTKKSTTRRNAWGNMSYADLITRAISDSPEKRLTLSQVYEWMVQNVSYFRDKGDSNSSAGWKNSIRHNLSLHSRFMRIQNEGAGKSSWWVINPDAKPGRNPRRRANTMEAATKTAIDKKRRGARKRVETLVHQKGTGCSSASMVSIIGAQQSLFPGSDGASTEQQQQQQQQHIVLNAPPTGPNFETFRPRAQSTLSVVGGPSSSRLSPTLESSNTFESSTFDDFPFPSWMEEQQTSSMAGTTATTTNTIVVHQQQQNGGGVNKMQQNGSNGGPRCTAAAASSAMNPQVNELLDRTDQMRLEVVVVEQHRTMNGVIKMEIGGDASQPQSSSAASSTTMLMTKNEICVGAEQQQPLLNKQEPSPPGIPPPPSYQELSSVRRVAPLQTNPLLRQLGIGSGGGGGTPSPPQMKMGANSLSMAPCSSSAPPNIFSTSSIVQSSPSFLPTTIGNGCGGPYQSMPPGGGGVWMSAGPPLVAGGQQQQQHQMMMMSSSMSPHHHQNNNINLINASGIGQFVVSSPGGGVGALPLDLENVNAMSVDQALLSDLDVESMLRHDLAQGGQFDLP